MSNETLDLNALRSRQGKIKCPLCPITNAPDEQAQKPCRSVCYSDEILARHVSKELFAANLAAQFKCVDQETFERVLKEAGLKGVSSLALLAEQLKRQIPDARQCKKCGWGPVEPIHCADLQAHEHQKVGKTKDGKDVFINNHCPRCDHFEARREDWPKWNGVLPKEYLDKNKDADKIVLVSENAPPEHTGHRCNYPNGCGGATPHRKNNVAGYVWSCCEQQMSADFCLPVGGGRAAPAPAPARAPAPAPARRPPNSSPAPAPAASAAPAAGGKEANLFCLSCFNTFFAIVHSVSLF